MPDFPPKENKDLQPEDDSTLESAASDDHIGGDSRETSATNQSDTEKQVSALDTSAFNQRTAVYTDKKGNVLNADREQLELGEWEYLLLYGDDKTQYMVPTEGAAYDLQSEIEKRLILTRKCAANAVLRYVKKFKAKSKDEVNQQYFQLLEDGMVPIVLFPGLKDLSKRTTKNTNNQPLIILISNCYYEVVPDTEAGGDSYTLKEYKKYYVHLNGQTPPPGAFLDNKTLVDSYNSGVLRRLDASVAPGMASATSTPKSQQNAPALEKEKPKDKTPHFKHFDEYQLPLYQDGLLQSFREHDEHDRATNLTIATRARQEYDTFHDAFDQAMSTFTSVKTSLAKPTGKPDPKLLTILMELGFDSLKESDQFFNKFLHNVRAENLPYYTLHFGQIKQMANTLIEKLDEEVRKLRKESTLNAARQRTTSQPKQIVYSPYLDPNYPGGNSYPSELQEANASANTPTGPTGNNATNGVDYFKAQQEHMSNGEKPTLGQAQGEPPKTKNEKPTLEQAQEKPGTPKEEKPTLDQFNQTSSQPIVDTSSLQPIRLENIKVPTFRGELKTYNRFIQTFKALIGSNPRLAKIAKLTYLFNSLEGEALRAVEQFPIDDKYYETVLKTLDSRFGDPSLLIRQEIKRIITFEKLGNDFKRLRQFLDILRSVMNDIDSITDGSSHQVWWELTIIESKLSHEMLTSWNEHKIKKFGTSKAEDKGDSKTLIKEMISFLEIFCKAREYLQYQSNLFKSTPSFQNNSNRNKSRNGGRNDQKPDPQYNFATQSRPTQPHQPARHQRPPQPPKQQTLFIKNNRKPYRKSAPKPQQRKLVCVFCEQEHLSYRCPKPPLPEIARKAARDKNVCFKCLSPNHQAKNCKTSGHCRRCNSLNHHTLLHL